MEIVKDSRPVILIRVLVGWVFLAEGVLKFLQPDELGAGRFAKIGIPWPNAMGSFVGGVEIVCGALLLLGLWTQLASVPLLIDIVVALLTTKLPILLGSGYWRFSLPPLKRYGLLPMLHEARTDISMLLGLVFLLLVGGGAWALDARRGAQS